MSHPLFSTIIDIYRELAGLKSIPRKGWLLRGVAPGDCESVADHSLGVALLVMLLVDAHPADLDRETVLRMALLHDTGEARVGDITPGDGVAPEEKHRREADAVRGLFGALPDAARHVALWEEYERGESPEAHFVRQVDKLEMGLQAAVYAGQGHEGLREFFESARSAIDDPFLLQVFDSVHPVLSR